MTDLMVIKNDFRISSSTPGVDLHLHSRQCIGRAELPTVLFSHGFTADGTESQRMFLRLADAYNREGFNTVLFDHRGCGYSDGDFEDFMFTSAVDDIRIVAKWIEQNFSGRAKLLVIQAQSLGTAIACVAFANSHQVEAFVLWNLSANIFDRYLRLLGSGILETGRVCVESKGFFVRREFLEDVRRYRIRPLFKDWRHRVFFISSGNDEIGNAEFALQACQAAGNLGERLVIERASHTFRCQPELERRAVDKSVEWVMSNITPSVLRSTPS